MTPNQTKLRRAKHFLAAIDDGCNEIATLFDLIEQAQSAPAEPVSREATVKESLPVQWTGCPDADQALILLGRIDAPDDEARIDQLEQIVMRLGKALTAPPSPDAELVSLLRDASFAIGSMLTNGEWYSPEELKHRIDAKLASLK